MYYQIYCHSLLNCSVLFTARYCHFTTLLLSITSKTKLLPITLDGLLTCCCQTKLSSQVAKSSTAILLKNKCYAIIQTFNGFTNLLPFNQVISFYMMTFCTCPLSVPTSLFLVLRLTAMMKPWDIDSSFRRTMKKTFLTVNGGAEYL